MAIDSFVVNIHVYTNNVTHHWEAGYVDRGRFTSPCCKLQSS